MINPFVKVHGFIDAWKHKKKINRIDKILSNELSQRGIFKTYK